MNQEGGALDGCRHDVWRSCGVAPVRPVLRGTEAPLRFFQLLETCGKIRLRPALGHRLQEEWLSSCKKLQRMCVLGERPREKYLLKAVCAGQRVATVSGQLLCGLRRAPPPVSPCTSTGRTLPLRSNTRPPVPGPVLRAGWTRLLEGAWVRTRTEEGRRLPGA